MEFFFNIYIDLGIYSEDIPGEQLVSQPTEAAHNAAGITRTCPSSCELLVNGVADAGNFSTIGFTVCTHVTPQGQRDVCQRLL